MENSQIDQKRLKIAYHETGHAVMALLCGQAIQKVSLNEIDSPSRVDKYLAFTKLEPAGGRFTGKKQFRKL